MARHSCTALLSMCKSTCLLHGVLSNALSLIIGRTNSAALVHHVQLTWHVFIGAEDAGSCEAAAGTCSASMDAKYGSIRGPQALSQCPFDPSKFSTVSFNHTFKFTLTSKCWKVQCAVLTFCLWVLLKISARNFPSELSILNPPKAFTFLWFNGKLQYWMHMMLSLVYVSCPAITLYRLLQCLNGWGKPNNGHT